MAAPATRAERGADRRPERPVRYVLARRLVALPGHEPRGHVGAVALAEHRAARRRVERVADLPGAGALLLLPRVDAPVARRALSPILAGRRRSRLEPRRWTR